MDEDAQRLEVDRNYEAFERVLPSILPYHRDQYALMRSGGIVGYFEKPGDAFREGKARFGGHPFSIQEVTDEPIDLGVYAIFAG